MRVLIIGCGYVGLPTGARLAAAGHEVFGLRRNPGAAAELQARGIRLIQGDITRPEDLARIEPDFDAVVNVVSSTQGGAEEYRQVYLEGTRNLLRWLETSPPKRYLYTSSTSVYAQNDGSWVDESSPTEPDSATSRILVETEQELQAAHARTGFPCTLLRVAGIYGPARGHLFKQFLRGEATLREDGSAYINNIHQEDVAGAIHHLLENGAPGRIYNVVDNEPATQLEFFRWLAAKIGKPMPPSAPPDPQRKRGLTNKRISNAALRASGYNFIYPTFREGYGAEMTRLGMAGN